MPVRIGLLGSMQVEGVDGPIRGPRLRAVLARLAVDVGSPVSADRLLEDVWGDEVRANGSKAVAYTISRLRDLLDPGRSGVGPQVVTDAAGYVLALDADEIDVHRFARVVDRAASVHDDPSLARALADESLALWRGRPYADVPDAAFVDESVRWLEQLHLAAERTLLRARCALGEHAAVVPELDSLVRRHPLEESLVADLMSALWRSGRSADALRAFGDLRIRLSHELGIEPSADLQRLEQQVLSGSPPPDVVARPDRVVGSAPERMTRRDNLCEVRGSLVGRVRALDRIGEVLRDGRLVVLTGPGGTGKTRLSIEYAHRVADDFADGVWMVELASVADPALVMASIAEVFGLAPGEGASIQDVCIRYLRTRSLLLIVDNCEHVVSGAAEAIEAIVHSAPDVSIVATSRESLGLPSEVVVSVPPLAVPSGEGDSDRVESVALFLDRARLVEPGFAVDDDALAAVGRICRRVEGLPLAVELAAARLRLLSVAELADRLDDSFRVLAGSDKSLSGRHQTLEATVEWSYRLLDEPEQALFRCLSILPGSFDVRAVEAIGVGARADRWNVLEQLDSLVDKSLVQVSRAGGNTRFGMLEPVRQFAEKRLSDAGETDRILELHAAHFAALVEEAAPELRGPHQLQWQQRLDTEYPHVRRALSTMLTCGDVDRYLDATFDLYSYWRNGNSPREAIDNLLDGLCAAPPDTDPQRLVRAWFELSHIEFDLDDPEAVDHARAGLEVANASGDPNAIGRMEVMLGGALMGGWGTNDPDAEAHVVRGRTLLEEHPDPAWWDPEWERGLHHNLFAAFQIRSERTRDDLVVAIEEFDRAGDQVMLAEALSDTATLSGHDDIDWELDCARRSIEILESIEGPKLGRGHAHVQLGRLLIRAGEHAAAAEHFHRATPLLSEVGDVSCWAVSTRLRALCEVRSGGSARPAAAWLLDVIRSRDDLPMLDMHQPEILDTAAVVLVHGGDAEHAAIVFGRAETEPLTIVTDVERDPIHAELRASIGARLGDRDLDHLRESGADLTLDAAFAVAVEALSSLAAADH